MVWFGSNEIGFYLKGIYFNEPLKLQMFNKKENYHAIKNKFPNIN